MDHEIASMAELDEIVRTDRLRPVLVRCTCCRFTTHAQDVSRIVDALVKDGHSLRDMWCTTPLTTDTERTIER